MLQISAQALRNLVEDAISGHIHIHRSSRSEQDDAYIAPTGSPTEEEIDDFLFHNSLLDWETVERLVDPGLLGFVANRANTTEEWISTFKENLEFWATNNSWLGADESFLALIPSVSHDAQVQSDETLIWTPDSDLFVPKWVESSPSHIILALELLKQGKLLSELAWRDFEKLIGDLLESEGWDVEVTQATRDGGLDVVAIRHDPTIGLIKSVWQAKKYGPLNKVKLNEVRELSAIRDDQKATKAVIVTTNRLTRDAIEWVKRDLYRLEFKEKAEIEKWLRGYSSSLSS